MDQERLLALLESFIRINNKYNIVDKKPLDYGTGDLIYPSEIHLLNAADKKHGENITELGNSLGISKSAASQTVSKLVRKGFCRKVKLENQKNIYLELTRKGENAVKGFKEYKSALFADMVKAFEDSSDRNVKLIEELFRQIEALMDALMLKADD